jgi:NAD(P)H dehydrogenase (quinone)
VPRRRPQHGTAQRGLRRGDLARRRHTPACGAGRWIASATLDDQAGKVYELTGDTAWSLPELAAEAAAQSGTGVAYADLPAEEYRAILTSAGLPGFLVELIVDADIQVSRGALATVTGDLAGLLGRATAPLSSAVAQALRP